MSLENKETGFVSKVKHVAVAIWSFPSLYMEALREEWKLTKERIQMGRDMLRMRRVGITELRQTSTPDEGRTVIARFSTRMDDYFMERFGGDPIEVREEILRMITGVGEEAQKRYTRNGTDIDGLTMEACARLVIRLRQNSGEKKDN